MKRICKYKKFVLCEVTAADVKKTGGAESAYRVGDVLCFFAAVNREIGYEEWPAGNLKEAKDFVESFEW